MAGGSSTCHPAMNMQACEKSGVALGLAGGPCEILMSAGDDWTGCVTPRYWAHLKGDGTWGAGYVIYCYSPFLKRKVSFLSFAEWKLYTRSHGNHVIVMR